MKTIPERFVWTRAKYEQATELGLLGPDDPDAIIALADLLP